MAPPNLNVTIPTFVQGTEAAGPLTNGLADGQIAKRTVFCIVFGLGTWRLLRSPCYVD